VTERGNLRYDLGDGVSIAITSAEHIHYMEIEKMVDEESKDDDSKKLLSMLESHGLKPVGKVEFDDLCGRLTKQVDWAYSDGSADRDRLKKQLASYIR
jgi:hypothetical protein